MHLHVYVVWMCDSLHKYVWLGCRLNAGGIAVAVVVGRSILQLSEHPTVSWLQSYQKKWPNEITISIIYVVVYLLLSYNYISYMCVQFSVHVLEVCMSPIPVQSAVHSHDSHGSPCLWWGCGKVSTGLSWYATRPGQERYRVAIRNFLISETKLQPRHGRTREVTFLMVCLLGSTPSHGLCQVFLSFCWVALEWLHACVWK